MNQNNTKANEILLQYYKLTKMAKTRAVLDAQLKIIATMGL